MSQLRISGSAKSRFFGPSALSAAFAVLLGAGLSVSACGGDGDDDGSGGTGGTSPGSGGDGGQGGEDNGSGGDGSQAWGGVSCDERSDAGALRVSGPITKDAIWSGVVYLEDDVIVEGAEVTIEAGTQIVAARDASLTVTDGGIVVASGKENEPVRFCGEEEGAGVWQGLSFEESASGGSKLSFVLVSDAGSKGQAVLLDAAVLVKELKVERSDADGVHASTFTKGSAGLSVRRSKGLPVVLTNAAAVSPFPLGGEFDANEEETIHLRFETIEVDATFNDPGVPYVQEFGITTKSGNVSYEAGVHYLFAKDTFITHGEEVPVRKVDINGTAESPVVFEGVEHTPGYYEDLRYMDFVDPNSVLQHFEVRHANSPFYTEVPVTISDALFEDNDYAVQIRSPTGVNPASKNITVGAVNDLFSIRMDTGGVFTIPQGGTYSATIAIGGGGGVIRESGTIPNVGVPLFGGLEIVEGVVTISAGVHLKTPGVGNNAGGGVRVLNNAQLVVEGTAQQAVVMELGVASSGIEFQASARAGSSLNYVRISDGPRCLDLHLPVSVANSDFSRCSESAIRLFATETHPNETDFTSELSSISYVENGADIVFEPLP